jgi:hypothetical protein
MVALTTPQSAGASTLHNTDLDTMGKKSSTTASGHGGIRDGAGARRATQAKRDFMWWQAEVLRTRRVAWCRKADSSIADLARQANISLSTYRAYEGGTICPTAWTLAKLALVMEIPIQRLFPKDQPVIK